MSEPRPQVPPTARGRGLRLLDLGGVVAGFGLASVLVRTVWPRSVALAGPLMIAVALEYTWLGLAMSGPIILGLDPRRRSSRPRPATPARPGRLIGEVVVVARHHPPALVPQDAGDGRAEYTRAEFAWLAIGGYWIALTFLVVPARSTDAPSSLAGLVPVLGTLGLMMVLPRRSPRGAGGDHPGWTHHVAVGLLWTWPAAWALLVLLSRTV